jgi:hypothetical protein
MSASRYGQLLGLLVRPFVLVYYSILMLYLAQQLVELGVVTTKKQTLADSACSIQKGCPNCTYYASF